jgi:hypothetical protein
MSLYEQVLQTMQRVMDAVQEEGWKEWLQEDLLLWRERRSVSHHLAAHQGPRRLANLEISPSSGHRISMNQIAWVETLLEQLGELGQGMAYRLAEDSGQTSEGALRQLANQSLHYRLAHPPTLETWRCLGCGYSEATFQACERFLASSAVAEMLLTALEQDRLAATAEAVLSLSVPRLQNRREQLSLVLVQKGIHQRLDPLHMRLCTACGSENTASEETSIQP